MDIVFSGYSDTGDMGIMISADTGLTIDTLLSGGNGFTLHPTDHNTVIAMDSGRRLLETTDRGATWTTILDTCYGMAAYSGADPDVIWVTSDRIFRSTDGGASFADATGDYTGYSYNILASYESGDIAFIWEGSDIYRTTNGGINWTLVLSDSMMFESVWMMANTAADPDRIIAAYDYSVYLTDDGGDTWVASTTFVEYNWGVIADPFDADFIVLSNDEGIFRSTDWGENWEMWPSVTMADYVNNFAVTLIGGARKYYAATTEGLYKRTGEIVSEGPILTGKFPPENAWVSVDTMVSLVFTDIDGIDPSTASIEVDGVLYTISDAELSSAGDTLIFRPSTPWDDDTISVTFIGVEDVLGHASPDSGESWSFYIDKTPPVLDHREPDSGLVTATPPAGAVIIFHDDGCGTGADYWDFTDGTVTLGAYSIGVIMAGEDTIYVDFSSSGVIITPGDTTYFTFRAWDTPDIGEPNIAEFSWWILVTTGIGETELPEITRLSVLPNPFNSACRITAQCGAEIEIFDINGRMVAEILATGSESAKLSSTTASGVCRWQPDKSITSGVYLIRIKGTNAATKIIYMK